MINARKIVVAGALSYENVKIIPYDEQDSIGVKNYFEDSQISIKCSDGLFIVPAYSITSIHLDLRTSLPQNISQKVKRITLSSEITYENPTILDSGKSREAGIPQIFNKLEQFVFSVPKEGLFITADYQVVGIYVK